MMRIRLDKKSNDLKTRQTCSDLLLKWVFLGKMSTVPPANWPQISWSQWKRQNVSVVRIDESRADSLYSVPLLDHGYFRLDQRFFLCWRQTRSLPSDRKLALKLMIGTTQKTTVQTVNTITPPNPTPPPLLNSQISRINLNNSAKFRKGFWFKCITSL